MENHFSKIMQPCEESKEDKMRRMSVLMQDLKCSLSLLGGTTNYYKLQQEIKDGVVDPRRLYRNGLAACHVDDDGQMENTRGFVFGLDGSGTILAESLCRCNIGHIVIVDSTQVLPADVGRIGYSPQSIYLLRTHQLQQRLKLLNPKVHVQVIEKDDSLENKLIALVSEDEENAKLQNVFVLASNMKCDVRLVNSISLELEIPIVQMQMSFDGMGGYVRLCNWKNRSCMECKTEHVPPEGMLPAKMDSKHHCLSRMAPLLPCTDAILAGSAVQCILNIIAFKSSILYDVFVYSGIDDDAYTMVVPIDKTCPNEHCRNRNTLDEGNNPEN